MEEWTPKIQKFSTKWNYWFWPSLIGSLGFETNHLTCCPELRVLEAPAVSVAEETGTERLKGCRIRLPTSLPARLPRIWGEELAEILVSPSRIQISKLVWLLAAHGKYCQKKKKSWWKPKRVFFITSVNMQIPTKGWEGLMKPWVYPDFTGDVKTSQEAQQNTPSCSTSAQYTAVNFLYW